jgi:hypothetical protein
MEEKAHCEEQVRVWARRIEQAGMVAPAILFLELYKPLAFLGAQLLWLAQPLLSLGVHPREVNDLARLCEDPQALEALLARLEASRTHNT